MSHGHTWTSCNDRGTLAGLGFLLMVLLLLYSCRSPWSQQYVPRRREKKVTPASSTVLLKV